MNEKTIQHIIELLDKQDERILQLEQIIATQQKQMTLLPDYRDSVSMWNKELMELNTLLKQIELPAAEIVELRKALGENTAIRQHPPEVMHHHHTPKIIIAAAGLFLLWALACVGWYNTIGKLHRYQASDTKYRFLKLESNAAQRQALFRTDSLYRQRPSVMLEQVMQSEEALQKRLELYQQAQGKESEAKELRQRANEIKQ